VLSAANDKPMLGIACALLLLSLYFFLNTQARHDLVLVSVITLIGSSWYSQLTWQQLMLFPVGNTSHPSG